MAADSNALIKQLLKAEEDAEAIIKVARENRIKKLKEAHSEAETEMVQFREIEQQHYDVEVQKKFGTEDANVQKYNALAEKEIEEVKQQYSQNREKTIAFVADKVCIIDLSVSERVKQAMKLQSASS